MLKNEKWIVVDEIGEVHGYILSPYFSGATHLAETFFPEVERAKVVAWMDATNEQRRLAKQCHPLSADTKGRLCMAQPSVQSWSEHLQARGRVN